MLEVSPTGLQSYLACPRQYRYDKILRIRPLTERPNLALGTLGHKALEEYYRNHKHPAIVFREEAERWKVENDIYDEEIDKRIEALAEVLEHYPGWSSKVDEFEVLHLEVPFRVPLGWGRGRFVLTGRYDKVIRAKTGLWLWDNKFVDQFPSEKELETNLQFTLYTLAAHKLWPGEKFNGLVVNAIKWKMPRTTEPFNRYYVFRNRHQVQAAERHLMDYVRRLREDQTFVPTPGRHCRSCQYHSLCIAEDDGTGFEEMLRAAYVIEGEEEQEQEVVEEGVF